MIVEVGTSDFRTQAGKEEGLFIEPVKYYFDRLPECNKVNIAISNESGFIEVFYVDDAVIQEFMLPNWVRGCSCIGDLHPTVESMFIERGIPLSRIKVQSVKVEQLHTVIAQSGIVEYDHLKIDTEGHDCIILNDYLDETNFFPRKITFENNALSDVVEVKKLVKRLNGHGYKCKQVNFDMVCEL